MYVACILSVCHCLFSDYARQYLLKMGGATRHMLYFQLFIIVYYLANKVLLLFDRFFHSCKAKSAKFNHRESKTEVMFFLKTITADPHTTFPTPCSWPLMLPEIQPLHESNVIQVFGYGNYQSPTC